MWPFLRKEKPKDLLDEIVHTIPLKDLPTHLKQFPQKRLEEGTKITDCGRVVFGNHCPEIILTRPQSPRLQFVEFNEGVQNKIPFGVLTFSHIGKYLEDFIRQGNKEYMFYFTEFENFVKMRDLFAPRSEKMTNCCSDTAWKIFKDDIAIGNKTSGRNKRIATLSGNSSPPSFFVVDVKEIDTKNNSLKISLNMPPHEYGSLRVPHSYALAMTRAEMENRMKECYECYKRVLSVGGGWHSFIRTFNALVAIESTLGLFNKNARDAIVKAYDHDMSFFFHKNDLKGRPELFMQRKDQTGKIGIIEAPLPGQEEKTRNKFVGELLLRGKFPTEPWKSQKTFDKNYRDYDR